MGQNYVPKIYKRPPAVSLKLAYIAIAKQWKDMYIISTKYIALKNREKLKKGSKNAKSPIFAFDINYYYPKGHLTSMSDK